MIGKAHKYPCADQACPQFMCRQNHKIESIPGILAKERTESDISRWETSCVNACIGIKNPAAIKELIEAVKNLPGIGNPKATERTTFELYSAVEDALAALDQEPKS